MLQNYIKKPHVIKRMQNCYFSDLFDNYVSHLHKQGYKSETIKAYCLAIEHFGIWLKYNKINKNLIDKKIIINFIQHLQKCKCSYPKTKSVKTINAAINQLLKIIPTNSLPSIDKPSCTADKIVSSYGEYLIEICGISENTKIYRIRYALAFLRKACITNLSQMSEVKPQQIIEFVKIFSSNYKTGSMAVVSNSLRSFLKYVIFCGYNVKNLIAAVPNVANWRLSSIPKHLNDSEIKKFISTFNRNNSSGKRDYAMARCLTDLGLRCFEVANIKIKDINWHECMLKISRGKIKQEDILPLPKIVAEAISDYLLHGRPKSNSEYVFLFHRAPFAENVKATTVRAAVRRTFQKAGFNPIPSTHILRHSFATKLLNAGSSIKEIADMLRHRNIDTAMIYTKVDLLHLRDVVMPWIGRIS